MNKSAAVAAVLEASAPDQPMIFTTGYACRIAHHLRPGPNHFYMTGSMGLASSIGTGLALATGLAVVVVDGDGSFYMNPVGPMTAGATPELPLVHVVLDDGRYASTGGQQGPSGFPAPSTLAAAFGYPTVVTAADPDVLRAAVSEALSGGTGPVLVEARLTDPDDPVPGRVAVDLAEHAATFSAHVAARQGLRVAAS